MGHGTAQCIQRAVVKRQKNQVKCWDSYLSNYLYVFTFVYLYSTMSHNMVLQKCSQTKQRGGTGRAVFLIHKEDGKHIWPYCHAVIPKLDGSRLWILSSIYTYVIFNWVVYLVAICHEINVNYIKTALYFHAIMTSSYGICFWDNLVDMILCSLMWFPR